MNALRFSSLALGTLLLAACGSSDPVADYRSSVEGTIAACGEISYPQQGCPIGAPEAVDCLVKATAECSVSHLRWTLPTVEGDPIVYDAFVRTTAGGCDLVWFVDTSADAFAGNPGVREEHCTGVDASEEQRGCALPRLSGCRTP